jgi:alpha-tubulin suppressor-like RCC1 family protein
VVSKGGYIFGSTVGTPFSSISGVVRVSAGGYHAILLCSDKTLWALGQNAEGQLGTSTRASYQYPYSSKPGAVPARVQMVNTIQVVAAEYHTVLLRIDGTVWVSGKGSDGRLGLGVTSNVHVPTQLATIDRVVEIAAGSAHTICVRLGGTAWSTGSNVRGQLGLGDNIGRSVPVRVLGVDRVVQVAAGSMHTVFLRSDGVVCSTGDNTYGQLGIGDTISRHTPVCLTSISGVVQVACGRYHTVLLRYDRSVWVMGANTMGQLGVGTFTNWSHPQLTPFKITSLSGVEQVCGLARGNVRGSHR